MALQEGRRQSGKEQCSIVFALKKFNSLLGKTVMGKKASGIQKVLKWFTYKTGKLEQKNAEGTQRTKLVLS